MRNDERMPSGMPIAEAVSRASEWWNKTGRHLIPKALNEDRAKNKVLKAGRRAPAMVFKGTVTPTLDSGVLQGRPFDDLKKWEKLAVVKQWHKHFVIPIEGPVQ